MPRSLVRLTGLLVALMTLAALLQGCALDTTQLTRTATAAPPRRTATPAPARAPAAAPAAGDAAYLMVPGYAFGATVSGFGARYDDGGVSTVPPDVGVYAAAPALPDRAHITGFTLYFTDNDNAAIAFAAAILLRHDLCTGEKVTVAYATSEGLPAATGLRTAAAPSISDPDVDQRCEAYYLEGVVGSARLWGVRIDYIPGGAPAGGGKK